MVSVLHLTLQRKVQVGLLGTPNEETLIDRDEPSMGSPKRGTNRQVRKVYDTLINVDEELTERETDI
jgi:hypothetical protein